MFDKNNETTLLNDMTCELFIFFSECCTCESKFNSLGCSENEPHATDSPETYYSNVRNILRFHIFIYVIIAKIYVQ